MNKSEMLEKINYLLGGKTIIHGRMENKILGAYNSVREAEDAIIENGQEENEASDYVMEYVNKGQLIRNLQREQYIIFGVEEVQDFSLRIIELVYNYALNK